MSISYDGGMIVGRDWADMNIDTEEMSVGDWLEENAMAAMSAYSDCGPHGWTVGFEVKDIIVNDIDEWIKEVKATAKEFKELTGYDAKLIGTQDIW